MADRHRSGARSRAPPATSAYDASDLTVQFEQLLKTRRLNTLQQRSRSRTNSPAPSSSISSPPAAHHSSRQPSARPDPIIRNLPIFPSPPQDPGALKFRSLLHALSVAPMKYENPGLLDEALSLIPLDRIYSEAEEESQILQAEAASMNSKPRWGYQDCVIKALLK